jgi:hypothetical protein
MMSNSRYVRLRYGGRTVKKQLCLSCAIVAALCGTVVHAHHSIAGMYDESRKLTLDGVVVQFQFVNPHPFVMMDVQDKSGLQTWKLEMDNRHELVDVGVTATTLKPGDRLVVIGSPAYKESRALYVRRLQRSADGFLYEQVGFSPRVSGLPR